MFRLTLYLWGICLLMGGCKTSKKQSFSTAIPVVATQAQTIGYTPHIRFISVLSSNYDALIQPRITGRLVASHYQSGMPVACGDLLFTIDSDQVTTQKLSTKAKLEAARAALSQASNNYQRAIPLAQIDAISQATLDQYEAQYKAAQAQVEVLTQALITAEINMGYTQIYAPISGIASSTAAHSGDWVGAGTPFQVLTTISNTDTMGVDLSIPMNRYLHYANQFPSYDNAALLQNIRLIQADGSVYPYEGIYDYTLKDVSSQTGSILLSMSFPNPEHRLKAGQLASVEADIGKEQKVIVVPQQAVHQLQNIDFVWIIQHDSTIQRRKVKLGDTHASMWIIDNGLSVGEWVVKEGGQKLQDGVKVSPIHQDIQ